FEDALKLNYPALAHQSGVRRIVANLPYNVATPLIMRWLTEERWPPWYDRLVIMVQKEVAERFAASPGSKSYGRLAVLTQYTAVPKILFSVPPAVFVPAPKVASALIEIVPKPAPGGFAIQSLEQVTAAAFGQRRKMLRSSLSSLRGPTAALSLLAGAGIDPQ